jgi:hypothetical protein
MVDPPTLKSTQPMVSGGRSSDTKAKELSIVKMVKLLKLPVLVMVKMYSSNTNQETLPTRDSLLGMLMKPKLTESILRVS